MAGQNIGAGKLKRAGKSCTSGIKINVAVQIAVTALILIFAPQIVALFDPNPAVIEEGVRYLRICCNVNCAFYAVMYTVDSFATGTGHAAFAMFNSIAQSIFMAPWIKPASHRGLCAWAHGAVLGGMLFAASSGGGRRGVLLRRVLEKAPASWGTVLIYGRLLLLIIFAASETPQARG